MLAPHAPHPLAHLELDALALRLARSRGTTLAAARADAALVLGLPVEPPVSNEAIARLFAAAQR